jgi:ATP-dependent Clp protease protease subunit
MAFPKISADPKYMAEKAAESSENDGDTFLFMGPVKTKSVYPAIEWILSENEEKRFSSLTMVISSLGGHVTDCFALVDVMLNSKIPITTYGIGGVASCGLTLFVCGELRLLGPHAFITSHQYSGGLDGKHHELVAERAAQDWTHEALINLYAGQLKLSRAYTESVFYGPSDRHFSAQAAVNVGLAHSIRGKAIGAAK